eukprot:g17913.t1
MVEVVLSLALTVCLAVVLRVYLLGKGDWSVLLPASWSASWHSRAVRSSQQLCLRSQALQAYLTVDVARRELSWGQDLHATQAVWTAAPAGQDKNKFDQAWLQCCTGQYLSVVKGKVCLADEPHSWRWLPLSGGQLALRSVRREAYLSARAVGGLELNSQGHIARSELFTAQGGGYEGPPCLFTLSGRVNQWRQLLTSPSFRLLQRLLSQQKKSYLAMLVLRCLSALAALAVAEVGRRLYDLAGPARVQQQRVWLLLALLASAMATQIGLDVALGCVARSVQERTGLGMEAALLAHLLRLPYSFFDRPGFSHHVFFFYAQQLKDFMLNSALGAQLLRRTKLRLQMERDLEKLALQRSKEQALSGVLAVKAASLEWSIERSTQLATGRAVEICERLEPVEQAQKVAQLLPAKAAHVAALGLGFALLASGQIGVGGMLAFLSMQDKIAEPLIDLCGVLMHLDEVLVAATSVSDVLSLPTEQLAHGQQLSNQPPRIECRGLSFSYHEEQGDGKEQVLRDVNLTVEAGETVALVGPSGAGKSTLIKLLLKLHQPTHGDIFVDGVPLSSISTQSVRTNVSLVAQSLFLFDASVEHNISLALDLLPQQSSFVGAASSHSHEDTASTSSRRCSRCASSSPEAASSSSSSPPVVFPCSAFCPCTSPVSDGPTVCCAVERAACWAQAHSFILQLPKGYQTTLSGNGSALSGGQKQRLGIARAAYRRCPIVVLDEPTSALDAETEASFQSELCKWTRGATTIVIAHRLSTIRHVQKVFFLDEGRVVEAGSPKELLGKRGRFYQYWQLQTSCDSVALHAAPALTYPRPPARCRSSTSEMQDHLV